MSIESVYVKDIDNEEIISIEELFKYLSGFYPLFIYDFDWDLFVEYSNIAGKRFTTTRLKIPYKSPIYSKEQVHEFSQYKMKEDNKRNIIKYTREDLKHLIFLCREFMSKQKITFFVGLEETLKNNLSCVVNSNITNIIIDLLKEN